MGSCKKLIHDWQCYDQDSKQGPDQKGTALSLWVTCSAHQQAWATALLTSSTNSNALINILQVCSRQEAQTHWPLGRKLCPLFLFHWQPAGLMQLVNWNSGLFMWTSAFRLYCVPGAISCDIARIVYPQKVCPSKWAVLPGIQTPGRCEETEESGSLREWQFNRIVLCPLWHTHTNLAQPILRQMQYVIYIKISAATWGSTRSGTKLLHIALSGAPVCPLSFYYWVEARLWVWQIRKVKLEDVPLQVLQARSDQPCSKGNIKTSTRKIQ